MSAGGRWNAIRIVAQWIYLFDSAAVKSSLHWCESEMHIHRIIIIIMFDAQCLTMTAQLKKWKHKNQSPCVQCAVGHIVCICGEFRHLWHKCTKGTFPLIRPNTHTHTRNRRACIPKNVYFHRVFEVNNEISQMEERQLCIHHMRGCTSVIIECLFLSVSFPFLKECFGGRASYFSVRRRQRWWRRRRKWNKP